MRLGPIFALTVTSILLLTACASQKCETAEPKSAQEVLAIEDWVPDESLEDAKRHEVDPPEVDPHADLSEEQRTDKARTLFEEAEGLAAQERWAEAEAKYEEAYHLMPGKHGLAYKVATAATKAGDCEKARVFFEHFLIYGDLERQQPLLHEALVEHRKLECWHR